MRTSRFAVCVAVIVCLALSRTSFAGTPTINACSPCTATFNVNSTFDAIDANPGDGVCATAGQVCSLRAAIMEGNATSPNFLVQVNIPAGVYTLTIPGMNEVLSATGDLNVRRNMTISGAGSASTIVQASPTGSSTGIDRVFGVTGDFAATINDLTMRFGNASSTLAGEGGALVTSADLTLNRCVLTSNEGLNGGAISAFYNSTSVRTLTLNSCTVSNNSNGAVAVSGTISSYQFVAHDSTFSGNSTPFSYGCFYAYDSAVLTFTGCTFAGNSAASNGGAIALVGSSALDTVHASLTNCTISGNTATSGAVAYLNGAAVALSLTNVTTANNSSGVHGANHGETVTIQNTILADNSLNCSGANFVSSGHNLSTDLTCASFFIAAGDLNATYPKLGNLALNAPGTMATHRLRAGSPALDSATGCPGTDERGVTRPQGVACDMGAFELAGGARFDSSADRKGDLFWRNSASGSNSMWFMDGTSVAFSIGEATVVDADFKVVGIGDFNGDGKADILWRNASTGTNIIWFMDGGTLASSAMLPSVVDPNWVVGAVGDFQGDGKADIFWHHLSSGSNSVWLMNGATIAVSASLAPVPDPNWIIAGSGDFDASGLDAIVWRNVATGSNAIWFMNGPVVGATDSLHPVPDVTWQIAGIGDFDGDGRADILWRNAASGANAMWLMIGATINVSATVTPVPDTNWKVARIADFQGDGKADILWRNAASGANSQWLMDGATIAVSSTLPGVPDPTWHIVP